MRLAGTVPVFALALLVGTCAACGTAPPPKAQAPAPSPSQRVIELEQRTVALTKVDEDEPDAPPVAFCSGVWVANDAFLTAGHCVRGKAIGDTVQYATRAAEGVGALLARDEAHDLALVRDRTAPAHASAKISTATVGQNVHTMGHPLGMRWSYSRGEVSALRNVSFSEGEVMWYVQSTAPISPGNSGGGLFDDDGNVIGVCVAQLRSGQGLNLFVDSRYLKALIDSDRTGT